MNNNGFWIWWILVLCFVAFESQINRTRHSIEDKLNALEKSIEKVEFQVIKSENNVCDVIDNFEEEHNSSLTNFVQSEPIKWDPKIDFDYHCPDLVITSKYHIAFSNITKTPITTVPYYCKNFSNELGISVDVSGLETNEHAKPPTNMFCNYPITYMRFIDLNQQQTYILETNENGKPVTNIFKEYHCENSSNF